MVWFTERILRRACAAALAALCCGVAGAAEDESDRWFNRHAESLWRPLVEKWTESKAAMTSPVENLMLPLGYYENGRIKAVLRAQKSQMYADGLIYAEGVRVEMLTVDGKPDGQLQADGCLFDRKNKRGYCEGVVHMVKGTDRLKGRGMYFSIDEQFIKILSECEIRTNRIPVKLGRIS